MNLNLNKIRILCIWKPALVLKSGRGMRFYPRSECAESTSPLLQTEYTFGLLLLQGPRLLALLSISPLSQLLFPSAHCQQWLQSPRSAHNLWCKRRLDVRAMAVSASRYELLSWVLIPANCYHLIITLADISLHGQGMWKLVGLKGALSEDPGTWDCGINRMFPGLSSTRDSKGAEPQSVIRHRTQTCGCLRNHCLQLPVECDWSPTISC